VFFSPSPSSHGGRRSGVQNYQDVEAREGLHARLVCEHHAVMQVSSGAANQAQTLPLASLEQRP